MSRLFHFLSEDLFRIGAWDEKHTCESTLFDSDDHLNFFQSMGFPILVRFSGRHVDGNAMKYRNKTPGGPRGILLITN